MNELAEDLVQKDRPKTLREGLGDYIGKFQSGTSEGARDHDRILQSITEEQRRKGHL
ncbi:MAG TPA: hypothetical protein VGS41_17490 [Chthonomonadales bacterium]|nr:hypothetical protein [Chthonomonadales bacterium]